MGGSKCGDSQYHINVSKQFNLVFGSLTHTASDLMCYYFGDLP